MHSRRAENEVIVDTAPRVEADVFWSRLAEALLDPYVDEPNEVSSFFDTYGSVASVTRSASVLVPLYRSKDGPGVLLVKRSHSVRLHKGEICFPGGSIEDSDSDPLAAALRETEEEIGIPRDSIEIVGRLPAFTTAISSYLVVPFVGVIPFEPGIVRPEPQEVAEVMWVPISQFLCDGSFSTEQRRLGDVDFSVYSFRLQSGDVVWGLTGRIMHELFHRMGLVID